MLEGYKKLKTWKMEDNITITPTVLATSEEEYQEKITIINESPDLEGGWVQIDLMDGKFVGNTSVGLEVVEKYPTTLKKEAHLMVENPDAWVEKLAELGFQRIIFHVEAGNAQEVLEKIKSYGIETGIALNPETPVAKIEAFVHIIDVVLLMSVHPGLGGQEFLPEVLSKVREASNLQGKNHFLIEVDGGVDETDDKQLVENGVNILAIGEKLINGDITENLETIWSSIRS